MKKEQIVDIFLKKGMSIDSKGLDYFYEKPEQIDIFLEKVKELKETPATVGVELIKNILVKFPIEIEEIKTQISAKKIISVDDVSRTLVERYEKIKKIFSTRLDLVNPVSINKINPKTKRFSLVVMVKEKDEKNKTLVVEDLTGEMTIDGGNIDFDLILPDEVLGLVCEGNGEIKAVSLLWPDIPMKRDIPKTEEGIFCIFLSNLHLEQDFDGKTQKILKEIQQLNYKQLLVFLFSESSNDKKTLENFIKKLPSDSRVIIIQKSTESLGVENAICFSSPALLNIDKKIRILLCDGEMFSTYKNIWVSKKSEEIMLNLLKKRHLDPIFALEKALIEDQLIIDTVPDIFVSGKFNSPGMMNYKGTTIISCGSFSTEPVYWIVNLGTRECIKANLV